MSNYKQLTASSILLRFQQISNALLLTTYFAANNVSRYKLFDIYIYVLFWNTHYHLSLIIIFGAATGASFLVRPRLFSDTYFSPFRSLFLIKLGLHLNTSSILIPFNHSYTDTFRRLFHHLFSLHSIPDDHVGFRQSECILDHNRYLNKLAISWHRELLLRSWLNASLYDMNLC